MLSAARIDEPAISKDLFLGTLGALRSLGVDVEAALSKLGVSMVDLQKLPHRLAPATMYDLWEAVTEITGERGFGLRLAKSLRARHFPLLGEIIATSATVGDALARTFRLFRLVSETNRFSGAFDAQHAVVSLETVHSGQIHSEAVEFLIGAMTNITRRFSAQAPPPLEVRFKHDAPKNAGYAAEFFECPVRFSAWENAITFDSRTLSLPIKGHDAERCASLQRQAEAMLGDIVEPGVFFRDVLGAISGEIAEGDATIERVSARLGLHPKALARRLRTEGATYRQVLDEVRLRLARGYLEESGVSVAQIAFRLGYSEKSAFNRAFKRWTGKAPDEYRRR